MLSVVPGVARRQTVAELSSFRMELYAAMPRRADALFELTDAVLCAGGPVVSLPELSLETVHRRGHGAMYNALAQGRLDVSRLRLALAGLTLPRGTDGQISIALDVTAWPRPDAECSPGRLHCYRPCRCDGVRQTIPGWPYQIAAALGGGRTSWTGPLDALRLGPDDDLTEVTAAQIRDLLACLREAGQWHEGDPSVLFVLDAGYDIVRLTWLLRDEPVRLLGRIRADRVMHHPPGRRRGPTKGRQPRHGAPFRLADPATHPAPIQESTTRHDRFGAVTARCWQRLHPKLERRQGGWADHPGDLPNVEGTLVHLAVERLPGNRDPKPLWLWHSVPDATVHDVDRLWRIFLRRFDIEHIPVLQAGPGHDPPPPASPRSGRPLGLAGDRRLHPAPTRSHPHRRSAPALGEAPHIGSAHSRPGPPRLSPHPQDPGHSCEPAESHPPRPWPPTRPHHQPRTPPPRRQTPTQKGHPSVRRTGGVL